MDMALVQAGHLVLHIPHNLDVWTNQIRSTGCQIYNKLTTPRI